MEKFSQNISSEDPSDHDRRIALDFPWAMSEKQRQKMIEDPTYDPTQDEESQ